MGERMMRAHIQVQFSGPEDKVYDALRRIEAVAQTISGVKFEGAHREEVEDEAR